MLWMNAGKQETTVAVFSVSKVGRRFVGLQGAMSALARFVRPLPASSRAYSFFSRSGGGGRYFTSSKVPKAVVASKAATPKAEPTPEHDAQQTSPASANPSPVVNTADKPSTASSQTSSTAAPQAPATTEVSYRASDSILLQSQTHPVLNARDFKLHQFFSLHRPLLLLSQPHTILDSAHASSFLPSEINEAETYITTPQWLLDEFSEAAADADAATAHQLARAITMTHAGAAVSWEQTLRRLGLVEKDDVAPEQEKQENKSQDVVMDSTKRKRRKKMKKHK